eukprot:CAMPEP_0119271062 /NCGR_PEP_ID=MMETSP1329-20130426/7809_1 /TAXON_ID=114041 /ORGANISM="Genus nov. species nov., Strain RCC1024" /LENGTH=82 /DNA_ID=CAMNT_0007271103 /DNA_START=250 /DNA_END=495 /DNA_ORIENTATION=+
MLWRPVRKTFNGAGLVASVWTAVEIVYPSVLYCEDRAYCMGPFSMVQQMGLRWCAENFVIRFCFVCLFLGLWVALTHEDVYS